MRLKKVQIAIAIALSVVIATPIVQPVNPDSSVECSAKKKKKKKTYVYITPTGKKYHKRKCGNGNYNKVTLKHAKSLGLTPCKKCY